MPIPTQEDRTVGLPHMKSRNHRLWTRSANGFANRDAAGRGDAVAERTASLSGVSPRTTTRPIDRICATPPGMSPTWKN